MQHKRTKLENPVRLQELNPVATLLRAGLSADQVVCDIGAGTGIFAFAAAQVSIKMVYALDINEKMLEIIREKAKLEGIANVEVLKVQGDTFELKDSVIDLAIIATVLHEIENQTPFIEEIKRILKPTGKLMIIEFHKKETPMGPPLDHRMGVEEVAGLMKDAGLRELDVYDLGPNFYCGVYRVKETT